MKDELNHRHADNVQILDPFTGTGQFYLKVNSIWNNLMRN